MSPRWKSTAARLLTVALAVALAIAGTFLAASPAAARPVQEDRIVLPAGFEPEGIAAKGPRFYAGSLVGKGVAIGRFSDDRSSRVRAMKGASLRGMRIDPRTGFLWVVGSKGDRGMVWVVVPRPNGVLATRARLPRAVFPNDITFTQRAAFITDSGRNVLYRVPRSRPQAFPAFPLPVETVRVTGSIAPVRAGDFGLNGIRTLPSGRLLAVDSRDGTLYEVRHDGQARRLSVSGAVQLSSGDGLVRRGHTLWVVRGQGGNDVVQLRLREDLGEVVAYGGRVLTDDDLSVPSTAVLHRGALWVVNARFGVDTNRFYISRLGVR